jgi:uridylate kinase
MGASQAEGGPRWRRVLIKLSGEILAGEQRHGLDPAVLRSLAVQVQAVHQMGCEVALVVGGGNYIRGQELTEEGVERAAADYMGMLGTVINALALQDQMERAGLFTRVLSALKMEQVAEPFIRLRAIRHLEKGRIVILAGGTGNPYFSTDTAAVLRAVETGCEVILKATKVDGVYSADPVKNPSAKRYDRLTYLEILERRLGVMDSTAVSLCMENRIPVVVFNLFTRGSLRQVVCGRGVKTIVCDP